MTIDRSRYPGVPADFPISATPASLAGAQPKLSMVQVGDAYYAVGTSPGEVQEAFELCDDLANQLVQYCTRKERDGTKTRDLLLRGSYQSLLQKDWCTREQTLWIVRRTALTLGWLLPAELAEH